jgi:hypothetical protein
MRLAVKWPSEWLFKWPFVGRLANIQPLDGRPQKWTAGGRKSPFRRRNSQPNFESMCSAAGDQVYRTLFSVDESRTGPLLPARNRDYHCPFPFGHLWCWFPRNLNIRALIMLHGINYLQIGLRPQIEVKLDLKKHYLRGP